MDQSVISGIGNIYSDEILWQAGVHPERVVGKISKPEMKKMWQAMKNILAKSISMGGDSMSDYRNIYGECGNFQNAHKVYRRTGRKCLKKNCGGKIMRKIIGGRTRTFVILSKVVEYTHGKQYYVGFIILFVIIAIIAFGGDKMAQKSADFSEYLNFYRNNQNNTQDTIPTKAQSASLKIKSKTQPTRKYKGIVTIQYVRPISRPANMSICVERLSRPLLPYRLPGSRFKALTGNGVFRPFRHPALFQQ